MGGLMRIVAFRQANHANSKVKQSLPDTWITEHMVVDKKEDAPANFTEAEGWQWLPEDEFNKLLNECNHPDRLLELQKQWYQKRLDELAGK